MAELLLEGTQRKRGLCRFVALLVAAAIVPVLTFLAIAWMDRAAVLRAGEQEAEYAADICAQQALTLFQTHELVARNVGQHVARMSWDDIGGSAALHAYLVQVEQDYPQVEGIWLVDPEGTVRNSSPAFPMPPVEVADRDYYRALRAGDAGTFIGQMVRGRLITELNFNVARRRETSTGGFDGLVVVSAYQKHLADFWHRVSSRPDSVTALVRGDGMVLARQPELGPDAVQLPGTSPTRRAVQTGRVRDAFRAVSAIDGVDRFYVLRRIGRFDAYVVHGVALSSVLAGWHADLLRFGAIFALAEAALTFTAAAALQQARREQLASARWRAAAERAEHELELRAAAEEQLRQSQKLEALGQMAGTIAHDFNNLLTVIVHALDRLRGRQADATLERRVQVASDAADRGSGVIRSLLAFARRRPAHLQTCDPNAALLAMRPLLVQALGRRRKLVFELADAVWAVTLDVNQFEMAILNLAVNARDAMPDGGTLRISTGNLRLLGRPDDLAGEFVAVAVADTGSGMPPEVAARALEPFFTTKPDGEGTGLGLSQVSALCRQCAGTTTLQTAMGEGTTVTLYLRRAEPADPSARPERLAIAGAPEPSVIGSASPLAG
jgi:two-component system NtrC family sensor kinase